MPSSVQPCTEQVASEHPQSAVHGSTLGHLGSEVWGAFLLHCSLFGNGEGVALSDHSLFLSLTKDLLACDSFVIVTERSQRRLWVD